MVHEIAKILLEQAETSADRQEAIRTAIRLGMAFDEIEQYLDWLDRDFSSRGSEEGEP